MAAMVGASSPPRITRLASDTIEIRHTISRAVWCVVLRGREGDREYKEIGREWIRRQDCGLSKRDATYLSRVEM